MLLGWGEEGAKDSGTLPIRKGGTKLTLTSLKVLPHRGRALTETKVWGSEPSLGWGVRGGLREPGLHIWAGLGQGW